MKHSAVFALSLVAAISHAGVVYNNIPSVLPANYPSLGYQATSTAEFGNRIGLAGSDRALDSITLGLSSWAVTTSGDTTFSHDLTVNIYAAGAGNNPGALLGTSTQSFAIPYHTANGFNGTAFTVDFNLSSLNLVLPNDIIVTLAFNTQSYGANPTGVDGPYNSLNFGLIATAPTVGTDLDPDDVMWNTGFAGFYTDGGAGGVGVLRQDTGWSGLTPAMTINAHSAVAPAPAALLSFGVSGLVAFRRRRRSA